MFSYGKRSAAVFLALYILTTAIIVTFSLLPSDYSNKMSYSFYDFLSHIKFGEDKTTEDRSEVDISSISITASNTELSPNERGYVKITEILPEDHTENYTIKSDDKNVVKISSGGTFLCKAEGVATIWAETDSGLRSNEITITVRSKGTGEGVASEQIEIVAPANVDVNQAFAPYFKVDGKRSDIQATFSSNSDILKKEGNYFIATAPGSAELELYFDKELKKSLTVSVSEKALPLPAVKNFYLNGELVTDGGTLLYRTEYEPTVEFSDENCCPLIYYEFDKTKISLPYSYDRTKAKIRTIAVGETEIKLYSPLLSEPLKTYRLKIIPPRAEVLGLNKTDIVYANHSFLLTLKVADTDALAGITCEISSENDLPYRISEDVYAIFQSEGKYTLTYRSEYYPDFEYVYTVIVENMDSAESVRKSLGHAALFAALGVFAVLTFFYYIKKTKFKIFFTALSGVITAAVSEILQTPFFTEGRGASIKDVFIDIVGFLAGAALIIAIIWAIYLIRRKKNRSASSKTVE